MVRGYRRLLYLYSIYCVYLWGHFTGCGSYLYSMRCHKLVDSMQLQNKTPPPPTFDREISYFTQLKGSKLTTSSLYHNKVSLFLVI